MTLSRDDRERSLDALRISSRDHQALLTDLDQKSSSFKGADLRSEARLPYTCPEGVVLQLHQSSGPKLRYLVKTRNLSSGGMGIGEARGEAIAPPQEQD